MVVITGGSGRPTDTVGAERVSDIAASNDERIRSGLLACISRWGLTKTTIDDVARESGLSRATVYRRYPGGKQAILDDAVGAELAALGELLAERVGSAPTLEACLVEGIHTTATHLDEHPALSTLAEHDPDVVARIVAFDRLDALLQTAGSLTVSLFDRFVGTERAPGVGIWAARLVVSYLTTPSTLLDLRRRDDVEQLVQRFLLPGLTEQAPPTPTDHASART